jgi:hypothetical protein
MRIGCFPARLPRKASSRLPGDAVIRRYADRAAASATRVPLKSVMRSVGSSGAVIAQHWYDTYMTDKWRLRVPSKISVGFSENCRTRSMISPHFHEA